MICELIQRFTPIYKYKLISIHLNELGEIYTWLWLTFGVDVIHKSFLKIWVCPIYLHILF